MRALLPLLLFALVVASSCDGTADDDLDPQLVVSASLGVGEALPPVALSEVAPLLGVFDPADVAISGATVTVTLLAPDGSAEAVYPYAEAEAGTYVPLDGAVTVLPQRTYRLDVQSRDRLTATTTTPPAVDLVQGPPADVVYGAGQGPEVVITRSTTAERRAAFIASTRALAPADFQEVIVDGDTLYRSVPDPETFLPVPIVRRFLDCEEETGGTLLCGDDPSDDDFTTGTSPIINEASYIDRGDGTLLVQVPFIGFTFYGPYVVRLISVDAALEAFVESQAVQGGGSTLSPGEIPNLITNVEGGLGVFGSYALVEVRTTLREPSS
jgi:hypothetical protein